MRIDEKILSEDLTHHSEEARVAIEPLIREREKIGIELGLLKKCDPVGERHPGKWSRLSVYQVAHRRLHREI